MAGIMCNDGINDEGINVDEGLIVISKRRKALHSRNGARRADELNSLGLQRRRPIELGRAVRAGFPFRLLAQFKKDSSLARDVICRVLRLPPRTLARRKAAGRLTSEESDRLLRLARLFDLAVDLFEGDKAAARQWLERPATVLEGHTPLEAAESEIGARAVEDLIGRLEFGVFS